jgi:hypothetical protein
MSRRFREILFPGYYRKYEVFDGKSLIGTVSFRISLSTVHILKIHFNRRYCQTRVLHDFLNFCHRSGYLWCSAIIPENFSLKNLFTRFGFILIQKNKYLRLSQEIPDASLVSDFEILHLD